MAHELINKLSVIVAECDLLLPTVFLIYPATKRVRAIKEVAEQLAQGIVQHQCQLEEIVRNKSMATAERNNTPVLPNPVIYAPVLVEPCEG